MDPIKNKILSPKPNETQHAVPGPKRLLVCLDRSGLSESTLPYAVAIAGASRGSMTLLHVLENHASGGSGPEDMTAWHIAHEECACYLDRTARSIRSAAPEIPVDTMVCQGHAAEQILCLSDRGDYDLIVLSSHGEKGLTEWSLSSSAEKVINRARASVLLVPSVVEDAPELGEQSLDRILVLLDGSLRAEAVLPPIQRLTRHPGTTLILLHVLAPPSLSSIDPPTERDVDYLRDLDRRNLRGAERYLDEVRSRLAKGQCTVRTLVERGDVRIILNRVAKREDVDLVALTAHGTTGNRRTSHGTTAGHLLRHTAKPVLMVQNLPPKRSEWAGDVRHVREAAPLRGSFGPGHE